MGTLSVDKILKTSTGAAEFTLPATDGTAGQAWISDGSGQLSVGEVTAAGIATDAVGNTQMADDAVGVAELSATGTASATTYLRGDNSWATVSTADVSGLSSVQVFTSSGTWTRPTDVTKVIMEVQGAGGSGSYNTAENNNHGGGGGGYAKKFLDVSSISTSTITVGAGGASTTSQGTGTAGGASSWADGTNTITGNGGAGGPTGADVASLGGTGVGGDINIAGGATAGNYAYGDQGGSTPLGQGGHAAVGAASTVFYQIPTGYGAGSGLFNSSQGTTTYDDSPQGGAGIVIVWEYK